MYPKTSQEIFTVFLEVLEGSHVGLVLYNDAEELANGHALRPGRYQDLGQVTFLWGLEAHGRLVGLDFAEQVTWEAPVNW